MPGIFYILFSILYFTPVSNYWLNFSGFLDFFPFTIKYVGSYGILILILIFNYVIFELFWNYFHKIKQSNFSYIFIVFLIFHFFILPFVVYDNSEFEDKINIVAIQGNLDEAWGDRISNKEKNFQKYLSLSNDAMDKNPEVQILVWPEYTFTHEIEFDYILLNKLKNYSISNNVTLVVGSILLENRTSISSKRYNTLYIFDKGDLLIHNAYIPVSVFDTNVIGVDENMPINVLNTSLGFALCYEENFPEVFRKQAKLSNPNFFILTGNQFLIKNQRGLELISLNSHLRAAEFNRYIIRLENTGLSKVINNDGQVLKQVPINSEQILYFEVPLITDRTFYSKYKTSIDSFYILLFLLFLFLAQEFLKRNKH